MSSYPSPMPPRYGKAAPKPFYTSLYFQVFVAIVLGVALGSVAPAEAVKLKPISDAFIKALRLMLPPIIFTTMALGIGSTGDLKKVGRMGFKSIAYFEVVTTLALGLGLLVVHLFKPGAGLNIEPRALDAGAVAGLVKAGSNLSFVDYLLAIIPTGAASPGPRPHVLALLQVLSPSERQVALLVARGGRNQDVAAQLGKSLRTVEFQLNAIYRKLGLSGRTELARLLA